MPSDFPRGSEWRKWDLHIHTPSSHLANQFHGDWDSYATQIDAHNLAVIGATNYFCHEDGEIDLVRGSLARHEVEVLVLPNVEFRIPHPNDDGEYINIHVIFSDAASPRHISQTLGRTPLVNTRADGRQIYCSADSIGESGINYENALIDFDVLISHLKADFRLGVDFVVAALPRGHGDFRPAEGDGRGAALAIEIDKKCQLMFGSAADVDFFLNSPRYEGAEPKPVFAHSDAHDIASIGAKYTWVKADPTFTGLLQTVYEPEERVKIQDESPASDFPKPFFTRIRARGHIMTDGLPDYAETDMPLNPNLVTIIGGRGTGKSLLLDSVFLTFDQDEKWEDKRLDGISPKQFTVDYQKAESEITAYPFGDAHPLSYLHVRQGDIKKYVESPEKLSDEIKKLLRIELEGDVSPFDFELSNLLEKIAKRRAWFKQVDSNGDPINSLENNERKVHENSALIETITTDANRVLIGQYSDNAKQINDKRQIISRTAQVLSLANASESELSIAIEQLNELVLDESRLPLVDYSPLRSASTALKQKTQQEISSLEARNAEIRDDFRRQGVDQDVSGLLAKVEQYQRAIDSGKATIDAARNQDEQLRGEVGLRNGYSQAIEAELVEIKDEVDDRFSSLKAGSDDWTDPQKGLVARLLGDINVSGEIVFEEKAFYEGLVLCLNGRKFRSTTSDSQLDRVKQKFNVGSYEDYLRLISGGSIIDGENDEKLTLEEFSADSDYFVNADYDVWDYLYQYRYRDTYLGVSALIQYKGKPPEKLSVGQRGTFYVSMKLATDPFGSPFIFDQPEDDLDNEFIMDELVPIFQDIKKYRQVIIATHNANLVVNADAEQVIVAMNDDEVLSYESGSLEHTCDAPDKGIREHVCTILEGGKDAFENRERKYGFRAL